MSNKTLQKFEFRCLICNYDNLVAANIPNNARYAPRFFCGRCGLMNYGKTNDKPKKMKGATDVTPKS